MQTRYIYVEQRDVKSFFSYEYQYQQNINIHSSNDADCMSLCDLMTIFSQTSIIII